MGDVTRHQPVCVLSYVWLGLGGGFYPRQLCELFPCFDSLSPTSFMTSLCFFAALHQEAEALDQSGVKHSTFSSRQFCVFSFG